MRSLCIGVSLLALTGAAVQAQQIAQPNAAISGQVEPGRYLVFFGFDEATLTPDAQRTVADAAASFEQTGAAEIVLNGYTDLVGTEEYNLRLSERRAEAVKAELIRQGVPASAAITVAEGEADPLVRTAEGVPDAENRRVEIMVVSPPPPVVVAQEAEPAPVQEPEPETEESRPFLFSVGGLYGYNMEDSGGGESHLAGVNLGFDYGLGGIASLGLEQAVFYNFFSNSDGFGGRSAAGIDLNLGYSDIIPTVGGNFGYIYGSGISDSLFAGPEIGLSLPFVDLKLAYDMPFDRGIDEGIILATIGTGIRF